LFSGFQWRDAVFAMRTFASTAVFGDGPDGALAIGSAAERPRMGGTVRALRG
jgi:hypothetical protein